jgi:SAM-dependent methyltransferase
MAALHKAKTAARLLFEPRGIWRILDRLAPEGSRSLSWRPKLRWKAGISSEVEFWDSWFRTKGLEWPADYRERFDPNLALQPRPAALLPEQPGTGKIRILDVGAGPLTYLGKKAGAREIEIVAVDPLASEYDRVVAKYQVSPPVKTQKLDAERLSARFQRDTFDLVTARNCLDHSYDPEKAVLQMIYVAKPKCYVLLEHFENEARHANWEGLHQWNFSISDGDFIIGSRLHEVNFTKKYSRLCSVTCERVSDADRGSLMITRIQKN